MLDFFSFKVKQYKYLYTNDIFTQILHNTLSKPSNIKSSYPYTHVLLGRHQIYVIVVVKG
jgi:hypothetical protein